MKIALSCWQKVTNVFKDMGRKLEAIHIHLGYGNGRPKSKIYLNFSLLFSNILALKGMLLLNGASIA